jgi:uncharacterized protein
MLRAMRPQILVVALCALFACESKPRTEPAVEPSVPISAKVATPTASASASAAPQASAAPSASTSADPAARAQPILWEVKGPSGSTYLFGTMHLGTDGERQLNSVVWDKLDQAAAVMMEADLASMSPMDLMKAAMLPEGTTLDQQLGPERWQKLVAKLGDKTPLPAEALKRFKAWFALVALTQTLLPQTPPMDQVMQDRAKKAGKQMLYLETIQQQIDLFDQVMTPELLKDTIDELDKQQTLISDMQKSYLAGDVPAMEKAIFDAEDLKKHPKVYELTFTKRNQAWMPVIEKQIKAGKTFVAVGAGHLLGPDGVVALLAKSGIKAERVAPQ